MMWAITSYYNPAGYERRRRNYDTFRKRLAVPLLTVEMSFDGRFELREGDADILIQVSGGAVLWQKERLLNLALGRLPSEVDNVAWVDCDIVFEDDGWAARAEKELQTQKLIQLFSEAVDLRPDEDARDLPNPDIWLRRKPSLMQMLHDGGTLLSASGQSSREHRRRFMGLAWAAKRALLEKHGFYDRMIIGGGDNVLIHAAYGEFDRVVERYRLTPKSTAHFEAWAHPFQKTVAGKIGFIEGRVAHLWHGEIINRNHKGRQILLAEHDFDIDRDLVIGENGTWHWARPRPELEAFLEKYFHDRAEDSVPESAGASA